MKKKFEDMSFVVLTLFLVMFIAVVFFDFTPALWLFIPMIFLSGFEE